MEPKVQILLLLLRQLTKVLQWKILKLCFIIPLNKLLAIPKTKVSKGTMTGEHYS